MLEQAQMESEDSRLHGGTESSVADASPFCQFPSRSESFACSRLERRVAAHTATQPEWYGPFLAERECCKTPRTEENVAAACEAVGLDELSVEDTGERQFFAGLIRT